MPYMFAGPRKHDSWQYTSKNPAQSYVYSLQINQHTYYIISLCMWLSSVLLNYTFEFLLPKKRKGKQILKTKRGKKEKVLFSFSQFNFGLKCWNYYVEKFTSAYSIFLIDLIFLGCFRFTAKLDRKCRTLSIPLPSHIHSFSYQFPSSQVHQLYSVNLNWNVIITQNP